MFSKRFSVYTLAIPVIAAAVLITRTPAQKVSAAENGVASDHQEYVFRTVDPPGSVFTAPQGINDAGHISGIFMNIRGTHGFVLQRGKVTVIDYPGAAWTQVRGINAQGDVVGTYGRPGEPDATLAPTALAYHGFLRCRKGQFTEVHDPSHLYEIPQRITSTGIILGCIHDHDFMASMLAFTLTDQGFTLFSAVPSSMHNGATPDVSRIAGLYNDVATGQRHGYLLDHGQFIPFDVPDSTLTEAYDINPQGEIVGDYKDPSGLSHGFLRDAEGEFTSLDFPGSQATIARGINARDEIVGRYVAADGVTHGFLARPREDTDGDCERQ
jgi:uncharacterized membrane protein